MSNSDFRSLFSKNNREENRKPVPNDPPSIGKFTFGFKANSMLQRPVSNITRTSETFSDPQSSSSLSQRSPDILQRTRTSNSHANSKTSDVNQVINNSHDAENHFQPPSDSQHNSKLTDAQSLENHFSRSRDVPQMNSISDASEGLSDTHQIRMSSDQNLENSYSNSPGVPQTSSSLDSRATENRFQRSSDSLQHQGSSELHSFTHQEFREQLRDRPTVTDNFLKNHMDISKDPERKDRMDEVREEPSEREIKELEDTKKKSRVTMSDTFNEEKSSRENKLYPEKAILSAKKNVNLDDDIIEIISERNAKPDINQLLNEHVQKCFTMSSKIQNMMRTAENLQEKLREMEVQTLKIDNDLLLLNAELHQYVRRREE